jgi:hypothetical protein
MKTKSYPPAEIMTDYSGLRLRLKGMDRERFLSNKERELFDIPPGYWTDRDMRDIGWRHESICVFLWALGSIKAVPPYDYQFDQGHEDYSEFLGQILGSNSASLRPAEDIDLQRELAEMWHWRSRTMRLIQDGQMPPPGFTFPQIIATAATKFHQLKWIGPLIKNDFPVLGKAYSDLAPKEFQLLSSIAGQRHYALNWLCGYAFDWDKVPTDT